MVVEGEVRTKSSVDVRKMKRGRTVLTEFVFPESFDPHG